MDSFCIIDEYDKASQSIQQHMSSINDLLKSATIESKLENSEFSTKFNEIVNCDFDSCFTDVAKSDYYNEKELDEFWNLLSDSPNNSPKKPKLKKAISSVSIILEQTTSSPITTTTSREFDIAEISDHLESIEKNLESITNTELKIANLKDNQHKNLEMSNSIMNLVFDIQKVSKQIKSSASTDLISSETFECSIDKDFILMLKQLNQILSHIKIMKGNENIITKIEKKEDVKFAVGSEIDDILSCIEKLIVENE
ncbi:unnamed protein product [Diamesa serratosioi]